MRKLRKLIATILIIICFSLFMTGAAINLSPDWLIRVGLKYGSSAPESVNIFYENGYEYGYFDTDGKTFISVYQDNYRFISVAKDCNLFWQGSTLSTSGQGTAVGGYHIEIGVDLTSAQAANELMQHVKSSYNGKVFIAFVGGKWRVRIGNYPGAKEAENAISTVSSVIGEKPLQAVGGSRTGYTVVDMNTGNIVFEFNSGSLKQALAVRAKKVGDQPTKLKNGSTYYYGDFEFKHMSDNDNLIFINVVDVQSYLKGVLPYEMSPDWPLEALKAQAVAARNFAYCNQNKHSKYGFDLCNTQDCQVYYGTNNMSELTNCAVDETYGQLLTYNGEAAQLYYHSSSGGFTENAENVWVTAFPYLKGVEAPFEDLTKAINGIWSNTVSKEELTAHLQSKGYEIGQISDIFVNKYTQAGNTYGVTVVDINGKTITMEKETMRIRLSPYVKSQHFDIITDTSTQVKINNALTAEPITQMYTIRNNGEVVKMPASLVDVCVLTANGKITFTQPSPSQSATVTFSGKGWGNNVGMSQWSARGMAEQGYTYEQILTHFFQGTILQKIV